MTAGHEDEPKLPGIPDLGQRLNEELDQIGERLQALAAAKDRLQGLLDAVLAISGELDLSSVLHRVVTTAMDLVGARYGALGVLHESGEYLQAFITAGLSEEERAALAGVEFPHGRGVLGLLIRHPEPLRVTDIASHRQLDITLNATTENPVTTALLARIAPDEHGDWTLQWSTAGHLPPLLITPGRHAEYLNADPGVPLGVSTDEVRPDHTRTLPAGSVLIFFTDGLVEHPQHSIDEGLDALAALATAHADQPLEDLVRTLAGGHPSDGHDDVAILALRTPLR
ncbi:MULTISPECIES: SpoIIE family protein phosphatase [unclassified Streptomyces]|uniref:SpoIIE family protein phosphatase n=1 Tax=unclassified Streptomyces TaxID=2593676 RepID=UPI0033DF95CD